MIRGTEMIWRPTRSLFWTQPPDNRLRMPRHFTCGPAESMAVWNAQLQRMRDAMNVRSIFTEPSQPAHPAFQYGMLIVILALLAWNFQWYFSLPSDYEGDRYMNLVVACMLLFSHLAYSFRWPLSVTITLRVLAWSWLIFTFLFVCYVYLVHILYPIVHVPKGN